MVEPLGCACEMDMETSQHLLFSCPKKLEVWQGVFSRYVEERTWTADYICSIFIPDPDPVTPLHDIPIFILIGTILADIWRYHHAFVHEDQVFEPRTVLATVDLAITQVRAQLAKKKHHNEKRKLPTPVELLPIDNNFLT
ncbi:hypothetical protein BGZ47_007661 [Haplosporangium gracile]|nr:hypothetical protein BGZ47_007661 [Haplosporangium gracile]